MKVNMILPAFIEAKSPLWRPIKNYLFPTLSLAILAASCYTDDEIDIHDGHVEVLDQNDAH